MNALFATLTVLAYAFIVVLIVAIIFKTPVKLGHKCKDKFGATVNRMLDNLFEN